MTDSDRNVLALLALGVGLAYLTSLHFGDAFGWPGLTTGPSTKGKLPGKGSPGAPARPPKGTATQTSPNRQDGRQGGPTKPDDGVVVDVYGPKVISVEEWKAQKARAARARARKKTP